MSSLLINKYISHKMDNNNARIRIIRDLLWAIGDSRKSFNCPDQCSTGVGENAEDFKSNSI